MSEVIPTPPTGDNIASNSVSLDASPQSRAQVTEQVRALLEKQAKADPKPKAPAYEPDTDGDDAQSADPTRAASFSDDGDEPAEKISAVVRARAKAARLRRDAEQQSRAVEMQRMQLEQERREVARLRSAAEKLREDPLAGLRELGVDLAQVNEKVALEGTPEAKFKALQDMIERQQKELETYRQTQQQREHTTQVQNAEREFQSLASDEEKYPYLAARTALHPRSVIRQAYEIQQEYQAKTGKIPTQAELAEALDYLAGEEYRSITERTARGARQDGRKTGHAAAGSKAPQSRTLSPTRSAERAGASKLDLHTLPREKQVEYVVQLAKQNALNKILGT
jgi:hypothetical protein